MATLLDGIQAKLNRADEHFHQMLQETKAYEQVPEVELRLQKTEGPDIVSVRVGKVRLPSYRYGTIAGDIVHNLRSALDTYFALMQALSVDPSSWPERSVFPIYREKRKFEREMAMHYSHLAKAYYDQIEAVQPFRDACGAAIGDHPLCLLQEFSNSDKHTAVNVVALAELNTGISIGGEPTGWEYKVHSSGGLQELDEGAELAKLQILVQGQGSLVLRPYIRFVWRFGNRSARPGMPVIETMDKLRHHVESLVRFRLHV